MAEDKAPDMLDDDFLDDSQFDDSFVSPPYSNRIVHSATSDTLDSVALGPMIDELSLLDENPQGSTESGNPADIGIDVSMSDSKKEPQIENPSAVVPVDLDEITIETSGKLQDSPLKDQVNISSYFSGNDQDNDPFSALSTEKNQTEDLFSSVGTSGVTEDTLQETKQQNYPLRGDEKQSETEQSDEIVVHHEALEARLSKEKAESVEFQVVPENNLNVMEASMQLIDDKADFESFTAESGPADIDQAISGLTDLHTHERKRNISETIHPEYNTQLSTSSQHSQGALPTPPTIPSPVNQPFSGPPLANVNVSPLMTPSNHVFPLFLNCISN